MAGYSLNYLPGIQAIERRGQKILDERGCLIRTF
jgi:hypothetical protein